MQTLLILAAIGLGAGVVALFLVLNWHSLSVELAVRRIPQSWVIEESRKLIRLHGEAAEYIAAQRSAEACDAHEARRWARVAAWLRRALAAKTS